MRPTPLRFAALLLASAGALALSAAPARAQHAQHGQNHADHAQHGQADAKPVARQDARVHLADAALRDQDGRSVRLKSEVFGERIVIVDFVYTSCTTVCPVLSATLAQVQGRLGTRLGREVGMVTVTVDPVRDTPARLKEYRDRLGSAAGWTWLTGSKPRVDEVLKAFGAYTPNFVDHPPLVLVGDAKSGKWLRFYGFPSPDQLVAAVADLTAARGKIAPAG